MVKKISAALEYDLFSHYSNDLKLPEPKSIAKAQYELSLENAKTELENSKKEVALLKEVIELFGKK